MRKKRLLQVFTLFCAFALIVGLGISFVTSIVSLNSSEADNTAIIDERATNQGSTATVASTANETEKTTDGTAHFEGNECVYQEVIIVYEDTTAAKESVEMIENSSNDYNAAQDSTAASADESTTAQTDIAERAEAEPELSEDQPKSDGEQEEPEKQSEEDSKPEESDSEGDGDNSDESSSKGDDAKVEDSQDESDNSKNDSDNNQDDKSNTNDDKNNQPADQGNIISQAKVVDADKNRVVVEVAEDVDMAEYIEEIQSQTGVKYAQPNYIYKLEATVDDVFADGPEDNVEKYSWHLFTTDAFTAWDFGFGDSDIVIGVIDTGIDIDHPDLQQNIIGHWDTADDDANGNDTSGHGTMVSGFIAAVANNGIGSAGVAPNCKIIAVDAFNTTTTGNSQDIADAVQYLIDQNVNIINMSFAVETTSDPLVTEKLQLAHSAGIILVAAAGNDNLSTTVLPADNDNVIAVMASNIYDDYIITNSNYNAKKDITAPGELMRTTIRGGGFDFCSGTSFAAPIVSGAIALMLSANRNLTHDQIMTVFNETATDTCKTKTPGGTEYGAGRINIYEAVRNVLDFYPEAGILITPEEGVLEYGETLQLVATDLPEGTPSTTATFTSSDETIATVSVDGLITANGDVGGAGVNGTATITATRIDGGKAYIDSCEVTVVKTKVTGVELLPEGQHIDIGETLNLTATVSPDNATNKNITFISSDSAVATVDEFGVVTGKDYGEATISVITEEGDKFDTCNLQVGYHVTSISVADGAVEVGGTLQLVPTIEPSNATNKNVTYTSSNPMVAMVDDTGLVTGLYLGTVTITATTEDGGLVDTCQVVSGHYVESLTINPATMEVEVGNYDQIVPTITPDNATVKKVNYSSSDENIATVDAVGVVWGVGPGTATITAVTEDGGFTDTTAVTVIQRVEGVELTPELFGMIPGQTVQLTASVLPENSTNKAVTYLSSDDSVASVDVNGLVTSNALGTATITVTTADGSFTDTCDIYVVDELITSSVYTVDRDNLHFEGVAIGTTVQQILDSIDVSSGVHIYNNSLEEVTSGLVSNGYYIRLLSGGAVVDEVRIMIKGDCNPDTVLDIIDYTLIRLHILNVSSLSDLSLEVADVNEDGIIDIIDYTLVRLHILEVSSLY